jgi:peptide/nickel transport system permease protein
MAGLLRITRSSVLEVLGSDYIRTARAKGLRERTVLWRHTVRNSLITVITSVALLTVGMMNGIVLVETVFGWPGLGQLFAIAVLSRDLFLVQGMTMLVGTAFLLMNFLADILYSIVDPRIRLAS